MTWIHKCFAGRADDVQEVVDCQGKQLHDPPELTGAYNTCY